MAIDPITAQFLIAAGSSLIGGMMGGSSQQKMSREQIRAQQKQLAAQLGLDEAKFSELLRQNQGKMAMDGANTTPNRVGWRQNQAMAAAIMPGLRNMKVTSNIPGMNSFIPKIEGGLRIPEGGFGPDTLKFFGDKAMLAGERDLDAATSMATDGRAPTPDYGSVYGEAGTAASAASSTLAADLQKDADERERKRRIAMQNALLGSRSAGGSSSLVNRRAPQFVDSTDVD